jgi:serine/threonine protein kinase
MAPEIMRGEHYDEKSDIYSYGMILWYYIYKKNNIYIFYAINIIILKKFTNNYRLDEIIFANLLNF